MSESDRGAYTPPTADAPLAFDARQPVRGARQAPVTLIVSGVVLLILIVAIIFFYRSGVRQEGQPPQTVGEPIGAMKDAPNEADQPSDPAASLQVYQSEGGEAAAPPPKFTAPPEEPAPRAAPSNPAPKAIEMKPAQPAPKPAAASAPKAAAPAAKPVEAAPATPKPAASAAGAAGVQIGAFSSKAQADEGWDAAARIAPGMIAGKGKTVVPVQVNGATLYRTTVTGFGSKTDAKAFCDALKAAGKNCFVK